MDGSMRSGAASDTWLVLATGSWFPDQTRAESPQKGGVRQRPHREIACVWESPAGCWWTRRRVSRSASNSSQPAFLPIFACAREAVSHWVCTSSQNCTRNAVPEGGVYVVKSTTASVTGMRNQTAEAYPHDGAVPAPSWAIAPGASRIDRGRWRQSRPCDSECELYQWQMTTDLYCVFLCLLDDGKRRSTQTLEGQWWPGWSLLPTWFVRASGRCSATTGLFFRIRG